MIYGNEPPSAFYKMRINRIAAHTRAQREAIARLPGSWTEIPVDLTNVVAQALARAAERAAEPPPTDKTKLN